MIFFISSLSLLGLILVPCLNQRHRLGRFISRYVLTMLTAMGVSALLCDVMFELIPTVRLTFPPFNITSIPPFSYRYCMLVMVMMKMIMMMMLILVIMS